MRLGGIGLRRPNRSGGLSSGAGAICQEAGKCARRLPPVPNEPGKLLKMQDELRKISPVSGRIRAFMALQTANFAAFGVATVRESASPVPGCEPVPAGVGSGGLRYNRPMLVLASQSPRRAEILRQAGIPFTVRAVPVDEQPLPGEMPEAYVQRLAGEKALAVPAGPDEIVLGADTTVVVAGEMLAKPADAADARRMIGALAGRSHEVLTGICLRQGALVVRDFAVTRVWFAPMTAEEIAAYAQSGEPLDKAGAYAIQGLASKFIERIDGCYFNVVGLPVALVHRHLRGWGVRLRA